MSMTISINLNDVEELTMKYIAADPQEWIQSFVQYRIGVAMDEIYQKEVTRLTQEGAESIPTNKQVVVKNAFDEKRVLTVVEANALMMSNMPPVTQT